MKIELKELSPTDGPDIYEMLQEIGPGENGFQNRAYGKSGIAFRNYLKKCVAYSQGLNLKPEHVPQTTYWLFIDGRPVGIGKLRHYLNDKLRKEGGHIGYSIRPSERGKGYGTLILRELLKVAQSKGINEVLLTCTPDNTLSRKVIEANGGVLAEMVQKKCRYRVDINNL
jgi:predicted acetyltransferase